MRGSDTPPPSPGARQPAPTLPGCAHGRRLNRGKPVPKLHWVLERRYVDDGPPDHSVEGGTVSGFTLCEGAAATAVLVQWAGLLGLSGPRPFGGIAGAVVWEGVVDGRPMRVWAVVDRDAYDSYLDGYWRPRPAAPDGPAPSADTAPED